MPPTAEPTPINPESHISVIVMYVAGRLPLWGKFGARGNQLPALGEHFS